MGFGSASGKRLAEQLAAIDLLSINSIQQIREALIALIEKHIGNGKQIERVCPQDDELSLCEANRFIMPTGLVAHDVPEFFQQVAHVTNSCLHFHIFEARPRLGRPTNDFSQWLESLGEARLAREIDRLHPYVMTLDEQKQEIVKIGKTHVRQPW
jgi:hypothetical protein